MTLPALIQKQQEKVAVTRLKNIYSALAQAFNSAISEYGTIDNWCKIEYPDYPTFAATTEACSQIISDRVMPYLRVIKDCNKKNNSECFAKERYTNRAGVNTWNTPKGFVVYKGMAITIQAKNGDNITSLWCTGTINMKRSWDTYIRTCGDIYVDINGKQKPNRDGEDLFMFRMYKNGIVPAGRVWDGNYMESFDKHCRLGKGFGSCTAWVIFNENMDYLHCDDLSWEGKTHCD